MADIDEELLALAGEASSDEEEDAPMNISRESSASADGGRGASAKGRKSSSRRKARRGNQDDSEEEGEASSDHSSPNSLQSAPMDESDSDSDAAAAMYDEEDRYPLEGKFKDHADKTAIMAMPEIKREELLAERAQDVERDRQNRALRQLLQKREAEEKKHEKKRKAGAADLEESQRKTSRQRTKLGGGRVGESSSGIDNLKRARAAKDDRQRRRQEDKERYGGRHGQAGYSSDVDADGDSDLEWGDKTKGRSATPEVRDVLPAELRDIERIRVGRSRFAQVCFFPGFNEAITGCFARISIGADQSTGQNIYRMAVIKGFTEGKPYGMQQANGKTFVTTQYVRAAHGKAEREWPFITCSDSPFTEAEWNRYKQTCLAEGVTLPTKPKTVKKIDDINTLVNRTWTEAELQEKLNKSGALKNKYVSIERARLTTLLKEARAEGVPEERLADIQAEIDALDGPKLAFNTSLYSSPKKAKAAGMSEQDRLARLNQENRRKNAEEVRQALIKERRAVLAAEAAIARGESVVEDHSRRVKTRAKFKYDVNDLGKDTSRSGTNTPTVSTPTISAQKEAPLPHIAQLQQARQEKNGIPTISKPVFDDDIIGSIDLGIEIDL